MLNFSIASARISVLPGLENVSDVSVRRREGRSSWLQFKLSRFAFKTSILVLDGLMGSNFFQSKRSVLD